MPTQVTVITEADVDPRAPAAEVPLPSWSAPDDLADPDVIDQMPTGLLVVDKTGTVRAANRMMLGLLGWSRSDAIGRSLLDIVDADDLEFAAEIIADGETYYGHLLGPMRIHFTDAGGDRRFTEFWARELSDRSGYVMIVPEESTNDTLADATRSIARGAPIEVAVGHIVASFGANPMVGDGCVLRVVNDELVPLTPWPLGDDILSVGDRSTPWSSAVRSGVGSDLDDGDHLDDRVRARMVHHGYRSLWCRPVVNRRGAVSAVIVVFRTFSRPPSPNQRRRLDDIVDTTALAFDQLEYRSTLELAAFTDPLTGVGSRRRLHHEVEAGISGSAVVYLDLDGFKDINDRYGHGAGDDVLRQVAGRLTSTLRSDDLVIRVGGDEFVLVIRAVSELAGVHIAARIVDELALPYGIEIADTDEPVQVNATASVGLCVQCDGTPFDVALQAADDALTSAKRAGKRRMHIVSR